MSIDWDKPLLVKSKNGSEWRVAHRETGSINRDFDGNVLRIMVFTSNGFDSEWVVDGDGYDTNGLMPRVYNKKPEPKAGEYWLIKDVYDHERVVYFDGKMFIDGPTCKEAYLDVKLIDKMERVEE